MIYVTGDTHGDWTRFNTKNFPEQKQLTKNDYVIVLGDFGIWSDNKQQEYWLNWLEEKPFTTLFIDGNHENYDILDNLPVQEWNGGHVHTIRPSVLHLMRGQVFNIQDKLTFTFGGASSHDIRDGILDKSDPDFKRKKDMLRKRPFAQYRINHISWWERELPNEQEMSEGIANLEKHNNKVDYILTHAPYTNLLNRMDGGSKRYNSDILTDYLQNIYQKTEFKRWLFGHMHQNKEFFWERSTCIYDDIKTIVYD